MIELLGKYKSVLRFILTFLGTYIILTLLYSMYLEQAESQLYYPDYITHVVAQQCNWLLNAIGYQTMILPHAEEAAMKLMVNDQLMARVVEGCNSVSVIILFWSFVLAFYNGLKRTLVFILLGSVAIYLINIFRIVLLVMAIYEYPEYTEFLHTIIFPAVIYGFVFLLWLYWVAIFKGKKHG